MVGKLKEYQPLVFLMVNGTKEENIWDQMVRTWHYLGYENMIGPRLKYLVLFRDNPIAAISFNRAALRVGCVMHISGGVIRADTIYYLMWSTTTAFLFCHGFGSRTWLHIY
jgi:hypothetical protein